MTAHPTYPLEEFRYDYRAVQSDLEVRHTLGDSPQELLQFLTSFFSSRYPHEPDKAAARLKAMVRTMGAIDRYREPLSATSYVTMHPSNNTARIDDSLICAMHRLIIEQNKINLTLQEIKEAADFFATRN